MNRKAILVVAGLIVVASVAVALAIAARGGNGPMPRSAWTLTLTLPASNTPTASPTNIARVSGVPKPEPEASLGPAICKTACRLSCIVQLIPIQKVRCQAEIRWQVLGSGIGWRPAEITFSRDVIIFRPGGGPSGRKMEMQPYRKRIMKSNVYEKESGSSSRAGTESGSAKPDADQEEMMKKVEAAGTPGPAHQALNALVGDWKAEVKCWMDPAAAPEVSQGRAKGTWKFNGRFLEEEFQGEMMGKPFTGRTLLGFDNTKQKYNSVWVSDTQTSMFMSEGKGDQGNKVITLEGKASCPATGRTDIPMKTVLRLLSPDQHVLEMYDGSQNAKTMEITYTRQGNSPAER